MIGYLREIETGKVISRSVRAEGDYKTAAGLEFVPCEKAEFDMIRIEADPQALKEASDRARINEKMNELAIAELKKDNYIFESDFYKAK